MQISNSEYHITILNKVEFRVLFTSKKGKRNNEFCREDPVDLHLKKCGIENPEDINRVYKPYLLEAFGFLSKKERTEQVKIEEEKEKKQSKIKILKVDEKRSQKRMQLLQRLLAESKFGTENWHQINNCLKAGVLKDRKSVV